MPFDSKNFVDTTLRPFSIESLVAWLEQQDPHREYCYSAVESCLWAEYTLAHGGALEGDHYRIGNHFLDMRLYRGAGLNGDVCYVAAGHGPKTFGAALDRARRCLNLPPIQSSPTP